MLFTDEKQFEQFKQKVQSRAQQSSSPFNADRFIEWKPGKTYRFRLIYWPNEDSDREGPFIEKYSHSYKNNEGNWDFVTCPTTFQPKSGFDKCPMCTNNSKLWKSGSETDKEIYKLHKRKFNGYALGYVVSDPVNKENNGKVKILRYGIKIKRWLDQQIFGITNNKSEDEELYDADIIGFNAFKIEGGFDFIVSVTKDGEYNNYAPSFSRKASDIEVDMEKLEAEIQELSFDSELSKSADEDLQRYYNKNVLDSIEDEALPKSSSDDLSENDILENDNNVVSEESSSIDIDEINIDEIDDLIRNIEE